ncbi:MAG TPA: hypothetical protein VFA94_16680 [Acidimicrobiales bacterium]|nr:hypothetical protein [Acidimicrobiales bacterium]
MSVFVTFAIGFLGGRLVWVLVRPTLAHTMFERANYRGVPVPVAAGISVPLTLFLVEGGRAVAGAAGVGDAGLSPARAGVLLVAAGFGMVGLFDDLAGSVPDASRGFRGHVLALLRGRLTTGGAKLVGGLALAAAAVATASPDSSSSLGRLAADAALVALAANLGNLLDRGPGRATKCSLVAFVALAVATRSAYAVAPVAAVVGAAAALLLDDLHERLMLGDTGANVLGGALGLGVVLACAPGIRLVVLVAVAVLNVLSEVVSFSRVIAAVPPLRALDNLGRLHPSP